MFFRRRIPSQTSPKASPKSCCLPAKHWHRRVNLQLESLEDRVVPTGLITLVPGSAIIPFSPFSQTAPITVQVTTPLIGLNLGTIDVALLVNGQPVTVAAANVTNGQATVALPVPGGLLAGTYTLVEDLLSGTSLLAAVPGLLTVTSTGTTGGTGSGTGGGVGAGGGSGAGAGAGATGQTPLQAAIEVAIDTAAILSRGNFMGEELLQIASQMFLNKPLASDLLGDLLAHLGPADGFALLAITVGVDFAHNLNNSSS